MTIREVRPDEWRMWRDLRLRSLADSPDAFGATFAESSTKDEAFWRGFIEYRPTALRLVAERDGAAVGMVVALIGHEGGDHRHANLYAMWVAPEVRGGGVGQRLVDSALRWCRSRAALEVRLGVSETGDPARRLYERCGFRDTGERFAVRDGSALMAKAMVVKLPPLIMGVVNVTPDSFTDGGRYLDPAAAVAHGEQLLAEGADILDIGGEATNPRATPVTADEELRRVLPVIERLAGAIRPAAATAAMGAASAGGAASATGPSAAGPSIGGPAISIDTTKATVARAAVAAGATLINDVSGGLFDPEMALAAAELDVTYIAGHLRGRSLADVFAHEGSVSWQTVAEELAERLRVVAPRRAWIDPGIGFGKGADPEGNVALLRHAGDIASTIGRPIVVGPSRKRFLRRLLASGIGAVHDVNTDVLDAASVLASVAAVRAGAQVVRVHNVALLRAALSAYNKE